MTADAGKHLIIALDYSDLPSAIDAGGRIGRRVGMLKVGLELFNSVGPHAIEALRERGARVFYDSKFYDIPNTVAGAAAAAARLGVAMLNVHALGGRAMMRAAREAAERGAAEAGVERPLVIAVTIVTSLSEDELREDLGVPSSPGEAALRLACLAADSGLDGVVCAVQEVAEIKRACGRDFQK
jgi:orotidine-5'-phosphate decarboxylase